MADGGGGGRGDGRPAANARQARRAARRADKAVRHRRLSGRLEYLLDRFLGTSPLWQLVVLSLLAFATAGAFGLAASLAVPDADLDSAQKGFWWALNRMLDGGNVANDTGIARRLLGVSVTMIGIVLVAALTSAFVSITAEGLSKLHGGKAVVFERGHVLVLGWSSRAGVVVRELASLPRRTTVVVLAERPRARIEAEIRERLEELAHAGLYRGKLRVIVRTGDPTTVDAVRIANPRHARVAIILPEAAFEAAEPADQWAMRALLALRREAPGHRTPVLVEVPDEEGEVLVRLASDDARNVSVVRARDAVARLLVETVRQPGVVEVIRDILSLGGPSLVQHPAPPGATTFGALHDRIADGVLVGVLDGDTPVFLPPRDLPVGPSHHLVVLARTERAPAIGAAALAPSAAPPRPVAPSRPTLHRLLLVGFKPEVPEMLRLLDGHVAEGATATLLVPARAREAAVVALGRLSLARLDLEVAQGCADRREDLCAALERWPADVIVLLAEDVAHEDVGDADARQLVRLLVARRTRDRLGSSARIVVEVRSPNTVRLIPGRRAGDFVVSREVVGMLLAQEIAGALRDRRGAAWATAIHRDLFDAEGVEVEVHGLGAYVDEGEAATFADLAARAVARGEIALGYFDGDRLALAPPRGAELPAPSRGRAVVIAPARTRDQSSSSSTSSSSSSSSS